MASKTKAAIAAAANDATREPVTVTGLDLLKLINATGGAYLTQAEGQAAVDAGFATVDTSNVKGDTALVSLTDAGNAEIAADAASKEKPVFEIDDYAPTVPAKKRGGKRGSKYPFESLEVGKSFHVPISKDMPNPVSALASSLTGARRKFATPVLDNEGKPVMEAVKVKTYAKDATGKRIKDASGKFVVSGETTVQRPKVTQTRDFYVVEAQKDDPRGPGARVVRSK